jgi:hypothetical protein
MSNHHQEDKHSFPWVSMSFICLGMLAHSVVFTSPLPYVVIFYFLQSYKKIIQDSKAFMVVDFGLSENTDSAGYYAG